MTLQFSILVTLHLLFVVVWFGYAPIEFYLRKKITSARDTASEHVLLESYLKLGNITGMIGSMGVLVTGILLSVTGPWGFFQSHWIATKQFVMILILIETFIFLIPTAIKISKQFEANSKTVTDEIRNMLNRLGIAVSIQSFLIFINFILGVFGATGLMRTI